MTVPVLLLLSGCGAAPADPPVNPDHASQAITPALPQPGANQSGRAAAAVTGGDDRNVEAVRQLPSLTAGMIIRNKRAMFRKEPVSLETGSQPEVHEDEAPELAALSLKLGGEEDAEEVHLLQEGLACQADCPDEDNTIQSLDIASPEAIIAPAADTTNLLTLATAVQQTAAPGFEEQALNAPADVSAEAVAQTRSTAFGPPLPQPVATPALSPDLLMQAAAQPVAPPAAKIGSAERREETGLDPRVDMIQITAAAPTAYMAQVAPAAASSRLAVRQGSEVLGTIAFQVTDGQVAVHIGQVLDLFRGGIDVDEYAFLRNSQAAEQFVALDRLEAAGIPLAYNAAYDELVLSNTQS